MTDDAVAELLQFARDVREGPDNATFEDKRRIMEMSGVKVTIKGGEVASVSELISFCTLQSAKINYVIRFDALPDLAEIRAMLTRQSAPDSYAAVSVPATS